jgi:hypothetical protein
LVIKILDLDVDSEHFALQHRLPTPSQISRRFKKKQFFRTGWLGSSSSDFLFLLRMVGTCLEAPPVRLFSSERPIRRPDIFCKNREI